jgi:hypothetical protein
MSAKGIASKPLKVMQPLQTNDIVGIASLTHCQHSISRQVVIHSSLKDLLS